MGSFTDSTKAVIMLVAAAVVWSTGGVLVKYIQWSPLAITGVRSFVAVFFVCLYLKRKPHFTWSRHQIAAAVFYAVSVICFVAATKMTTAANAILLQYTTPIWVAILAPVFLKESTSRTDWFFICIVLAGMTLFFMDQLSPEGMTGNFIAILSGMSVAGIAINLRKQKNESPVESLILGNALAVIICLPWISAPWPGPEGWLALLFMGAIQLGLGFFLYARAITKVSALEVSVITTIEPILNPIWVMLAIGETPGHWALLGGVLVLASITGWGILRARQHSRTKLATKLDAGDYGR